MVEFINDNWMFIVGIISITTLFAFGIKQTILLFREQTRTLKKTEYEIKSLNNKK
jgi:hypothetical protein